MIIRTIISHDGNFTIDVDVVSSDMDVVSSDVDVFEQHPGSHAICVPFS